jgi:general stress protein CsbA
MILPEKIIQAVILLGSSKEKQYFLFRFLLAVSVFSINAYKAIVSCHHSILVVVSSFLKGLI